MISEPTTPLDPFLQDIKSSDGGLNRTSADGGMKEAAQKSSTHTVEVGQSPQMEEQFKRKKIPGEEARNVTGTTSPNTSAHTDLLQFEMQKLKLDEQFKSDAPIKGRSRSVSQTSTLSSSSTGSIKSVIKKSNGQSMQSERSIEGSNQTKTKEKKRSHRKEKHESQQMTRQHIDGSLRSPSNTHQAFEELYMHPGRVRSLRRSSYGDSSSASSLEKMTQFIAQAINEDPDEIRKKLAAVEKKKTKVKSKRKQVPSPEVKPSSSESRSSEFNPLASSSPQAKTSPEKMTYSHGSQGSQEHNISDSPNRLSSYTMENSVFPPEDTTSMVPLSLKELDFKDLSPKRESLPSHEAGSFVHIIPEFGDTYTVRTKKPTDQQQHVPVIDPRKHRTHEIEQRLNRSLPRNVDSSASYDGNLSDLKPTGQLHTLTQEMTTLQSPSSPPRHRLETSDGAVGSMSTALTQDITNSRHSWPEATPSRQHKRNNFSHLGHVKQNTSQPSSSAAADEPTTRSIPLENVRAAVQPGNIAEGPPSTMLIHGHHTGNLVNQDFSQMGVPLSIAPSIVPFGNPHSVSHLYPANNINGPIAVPGMMGPILTGNGLNVQTCGSLSHTAPTTYDPRMVPLGSAIYPPQGLGTINTFHGHVPFVQTVSASMGPKPSSLTPTYVQSLNVDIPHNIGSHQIPLRLQTNTSNISGLPTSFTQPRVSSSMPYQHTPPQQVPNGLLQVRPDFSQGSVMPPSTQVIIPGEIKLPPFCCVGVLTETVVPLHNSSSRWMHCEIRSILSTANGVQVRVVKLFLGLGMRCVS